MYDFFFCLVKKKGCSFISSKSWSLISRWISRHDLSLNYQKQPWVMLVECGFGVDEVWFIQLFPETFIPMWNWIFLLYNNVNKRVTILLLFSWASATANFWHQSRHCDDISRVQSPTLVCLLSFVFALLMGCKPLFWNLLVKTRPLFKETV